MNLIEELAKARADQPGPTDEDLIAEARLIADHPDTGNSLRAMLQAILRKIDEP